jgi:hypothetical protein
MVAHVLFCMDQRVFTLKRTGALTACWEQLELMAACLLCAPCMRMYAAGPPCALPTFNTITWEPDTHCLWVALRRHHRPASPDGWCPRW